MSAGIGNHVLVSGEGARGEHVKQVTAATTLSRELCRILCRRRKSKRVDEVCRL